MVFPWRSVIQWGHGQEHAHKGGREHTARERSHLKIGKEGSDQSAVLPGLNAMFPTK